MASPPRVDGTGNRAPQETEGGAVILEPPRPQPGPPPTSDASLSVILGDLFSSTQTLVHQEVELVKAEANEKIGELKEEAQTKAVGAGLLAGAGIFAILGLAFLGVMLTYGFQEWFGLSGWLSALIVMLIYFAIAGVLALVGRGILMPDQPDSGESPATAG